MKKVEILAPAGSMESLYGAINMGADAIYLGGNKFSARAYASNFDNDNMIKAVDYAHGYGVKVYVAFNTILKENELEEAIKYVGFLYEIGVDALIIQDQGLFNIIHNNYSDFELHGSTQMTIHNGDAAKFFVEKGYSRIVLSREMSLDEIKHISTDLGIETEMFIHGALCISYSGQCLMSSIIGGRSGNRGRCAQPCRMEYAIKGENTGEKKGYLLSPKDMGTIEIIDKVKDTGVYSLKIEGRMKRPEYVAGVVKNYREKVDSLETGKAFDTEKGKGQLLQLFNRSGFTNGFLVKDTGKDMMSFNSPKNTGVYLGLVKENGTVELQEEIELGDGIRVDETGFTASKITVNGSELQSANKGDIVKIFPTRYKKGDKLYKSLDTSLFKELENSIKMFNRKIAIEGQMKFKVGEPVAITLLYNGEVYNFEGDTVESAVNKPLDKERIKEAMYKSGEVPYVISNISFSEFEDGFMRISSLNEFRRNVLEGLWKSICKKSRRRRDGKLSNWRTINKEVIKGEFKEVFTCVTKEQLKALLDSGVKNIGVDIWSRELGALRETDIIETYNKYGEQVNLYIKTSTIIKGEFENIKLNIRKLSPYIKGIVTSNIGIVSVFKEQFEIIGDYKLNIMNSEALSFYQQSIDIPTISMELTKGEIKQLCKNNNGYKAMVVYGKPELMVSEYCPIGSTFGGKTSNKSCSVPCAKDKFTMIDRVNEKLRVMTDLYCRSYILNPLPISLINEADEIKDLGVNSFRFDFRDESYEDVNRILEWYYKGVSLLNEEYTKGHYRRGVE